MQTAQQILQSLLDKQQISPDDAKVLGYVAPVTTTNTNVNIPKNAYPNLPVLPYEKTSIAESDYVAYIKSLSFISEVKRASYIIFTNESGHGADGVNNNYVGSQADGAQLAAKWLPHITGTCIEPENMTGNERRFTCFDKWQTSVDYLIAEVMNRGIYIDGVAHPYSKNMKVIDVPTLAAAYWREWVEGDYTEPSEGFVHDFQLMYNKAKTLFS